MSDFSPHYAFRLLVWPDRGMADRIDRYWPTIGTVNLLNKAFDEPGHVVVELVRRGQPPKPTRENMADQTEFFVTSKGTTHRLADLSMTHLRNIVRSISNPRVGEGGTDNRWLVGSALDAALQAELWKRILSWDHPLVALSRA